MLDDKDEFGSVLNRTYFDSAVDMVNYWWFERRDNDFYFHPSQETSKKVAASYIKKWLEHFAPCLDAALRRRNLIPYACTSPFNWDECKKHVSWWSDDRR